MTDSYLLAKKRILNKIQNLILNLDTDTEDKPRDFYETFETFINTRDISLLRINHLHVLKRAISRFELYRRITEEPDYTINLNTFSVDEIYALEKFLHDEYIIYERYPQIYKKIPYRGCSRQRKTRPKPKGNNTIIEMMSMLRSFFRWCVNQEILENDPFRQYTGKTTVCYGTPYYITIEERNIIADFNLEAYPALAMQRDIFVFQCLIGCRVSDLVLLKPTNIINDAVEYMPHKTKKARPEIVRVPLNNRARAIVERYRDNSGNKGRLMPFISAQKYNDAIKRIFTICGITRLVTVLNPVTGEEEKRPINEIASSHLARRTFIGNLYKKIKDPNLVGSMSGHKEGSKAFARYRVIDDDMKRELVQLIE